MSDGAVVDAVLRLTGETLGEGESLLITKVPGGATQVIKLLLLHTEMTYDTEPRYEMNDHGVRPLHHNRDRARIKLEGQVID